MAREGFHLRWLGSQACHCCDVRPYLCDGRGLDWSGTSLDRTEETSQPLRHRGVGEPADIPPIAYSARQDPNGGDCGPHGGATEELLSTTLLGSLARGHGADHSGAARVQRFPAPPAADPTGTAGHRAKPRRSCSATTPSRRAGCRLQRGNFKSRAGHGGAAWYYATLHHRLWDACSGGAAGATYRSKHLKALWAADSDGAAGRTGRRRSTTSEAGHAGGTVTSDY